MEILPQKVRCGPATCAPATPAFTWPSLPSQFQTVLVHVRLASAKLFWWSWSLTLPGERALPLCLLVTACRWEHGEGGVEIIQKAS